MRQVNGFWLTPHGNGYAIEKQEAAMCDVTGEWYTRFRLVAFAGSLHDAIQLTRKLT